MVPWEGLSCVLLAAAAAARLAPHSSHKVNIRRAVHLGAAWHGEHNWRVIVGCMLGKVCCVRGWCWVLRQQQLWSTKRCKVARLGAETAVLGLPRCAGCKEVSVRGKGMGMLYLWW